jgi:hypothetical protein
MKPEIKGVTSADVADWQTWRPADPEQVYLALELSIGPEGESRADLFQIVVATPRAIAGRPDLRTGALLVVQRYDGQEVRRMLDRLVAGCEQPTWESTVNRLRRQFDWEYEGMGP